MAHYNADDIKTLQYDKDRVQAQPHLYIPDKKLSGVIHLIREIKDNADDEAMLAGASNNTVEVFYDESTQEVCIKDFGRGIPLEKLRELCEVLHSSGKLKKGEDSAYKFAGGMHGVGLKITNFLSEYFTISTTRDGKCDMVMYEDGDFVKETTKEVDKDKHGTVVTFKISDKYLKETDKLKCKHIQAMIEEKSDACPGLITKFKGITKSGEEIKQKYVGLTTEELMYKYNKPTSKVWQYEYETPSDDLRLRIAFGYDAKAIEGCNIMGWTNFIYNKEGGTHVDAISDELYDFFKKYMYNNTLTDKEKKNLQIRREDIRLGLCGVVVVLSTNPEFHGQYKEKMISDTIKDQIMEFLKKQLDKMPDAELKTISTIIRENIKARMSSQHARQQVKKVGNGLSKDRIAKYYPPRMGCTTDYQEVYLTEGLSAGTQVEKARYDFQSVYMLRGKVDNIYDIPIQDLLKIDIISDLSRIFGVVPGHKGTTIPDRILGLTDADPDGLGIRAGIVVIVAKAFPQIIEEGKLFMVEPPLFAFKDNGKKRFVSTNREYLTYLQDNFVKNNTLYQNGVKMNNKSLLEFLLRNERYQEFLQNVSDNNICSPEFTELIISNLNKLGISKSSMSAWNELVKSKFSPQLDTEWNENRIVIHGIKNGRYEMIELDEDLLKSKKVKKLIDIMNSNFNNIYGYNISGSNDYDNLSINQVLDVFNQYKGKDLKRFKGLGEMSAEDLRNTCLDLNYQKTVRITTKDINESMVNLAYWHSKKETFRAFRTKYMINYVPDIQDIST